VADVPRGSRGSSDLPLGGARLPTPYRTYYAVKPTRRMPASSLNRKAGRACRLSILNPQ
jgi:hypothetical protein